jgi:hypothetical protein
MLEKIIQPITCGNVSIVYNIVEKKKMLEAI